MLQLPLVQSVHNLQLHACKLAWLTPSVLYFCVTLNQNCLSEINCHVLEEPGLQLTSRLPHRLPIAFTTCCTLQLKHSYASMGQH